MAIDYRTADAMYCDTDAKWRAYVQGWENAFVGNGGMVNESSAPNQMNLATTVRPSSAVFLGNNYYRMFRFDDGAQATFPIFCRIDYALEPSFIYPRMQFQLGTAIDTAGAISGPRASQAYQKYPKTTSPIANVIRHWWSSGGSGRVAICSGDPTENRSADTFVIERLKNLDGSASDAGVFYMVAGGPGPTTNPECLIGVLPHTRYAVNNSEYLFTTGQQWAQPNPGIATVGRPSAGSFLCMTPYMVPMAPSWTSVLGYMGAPPGSVLPGGIVRLNWLGADHDYMPLPILLTTNITMDGNQVGMIVWE